MKILNTQILTYFLLIIVAVASFSLGRLSVTQQNTPLSTTPLPAPDLLASPQSREIYETKDIHTSIQPKPLDKTNNTIETDTLASEGTVVASKNGTKYHFPWCGGAKQISEENLIFFSTNTEARNAGYEPAKNCKGLE